MCASKLVTNVVDREGRRSQNPNTPQTQLRSKSTNPIPTLNSDKQLPKLFLAGVGRAG